MNAPSSSVPEISLVIPTYDRPAAVEELLAGLAQQTADPHRFEVILVDDGSPEPVTVDAALFDFPVRVLRQENRGPGAARNLAFEHCSAALVLILNDDALPARDLVEVHLRAHEEVPPRTAVLGTFRFSEEALKNPFVRILDRSSLIFDFAGLKHDQELSWAYFWTCNISLQLAGLRAAGGFDAETFPEAIIEDVELGYRLEKEGWTVRHRADAICHHDHEIGAEAFFHRSESLGRNQWRMAKKHPDLSVMGYKGGQDPEPTLLQLQKILESYGGIYERFIEHLGRLEQEYRGHSIPADIENDVLAVLPKVHMARLAKGILVEELGHDPEPVMREGAPANVLTSIVIISHNGLERTRRCLEAIRVCADARFPTEILVVDNGSTDGSVEYLEAQADVQLLRNSDNAGAPVARNQAIPHTQGAWVCFMDNDAIASPGWLERMHYHGAVDSRVGCVCPVSDRAAHSQQIPYEGGESLAEIHSFARERASTHDRQMRYKVLFPSFCVLVKRVVLEAIGGFDTRFTPWGFEDDDFSLRAYLAGFRVRMALDVFVRHESYGGPKQAAHRELLRANWERFASKWIPGPVPPYGDLSALEELVRRSWSEAELRVPIGEPGPGSGAVAWVGAARDQVAA